jgi:hypothetical protein
MKRLLFICLFSVAFDALAQDNHQPIANRLKLQQLGQTTTVRTDMPSNSPAVSVNSPIAHRLRQLNLPQANSIRLDPPAPTAPSNLSPIANRLRLQTIPAAPVNHSYQPRLQSGAQLIYGSDFSVPADWVTGKASGSTGDWVISATGATGPFSIGTIQSTTRTNGFAKFDSDLGCSGNQHAWISMSQPISLSSHPAVIVEFQQYYSKYIDSTFVDVSTNGTSWTAYEVNSHYANNDITPNPETVQLNISGTAGSQPLVWIRFRFYSRTSTMGAGAGCGYAWMVDDFKVMTLPDNDLVLEGHAVNTSNKLLFYGRTPVNQLNDSISFVATAHNFGAATQPGTLMYGQVRNDNGSYRFADTAYRSSALPIAGRDTAATSKWFNLVGTPIGRYNYVVGYKSDSVDATPTNNTVSRNFYITDTTYRLSSDFSRTNGLTTDSWDYTDDGLRMAVLYELPEGDTITSVTVRLTSFTRVGALLHATVRDTFGLFTNYQATLQNPSSFASFLESDMYEVTAADSIAGFATITIPTMLFGGTLQNTILPAGAYYVAVELFSSNGQYPCGILDDESYVDFMPPYASLTFIPADPADPGSSARWWTNGTAHAVYANFGRPATTSGTAPVQLAVGLKVYPNPSQGQAQIDFNLLQASPVQLRLRDMQGRVLQTTVLGMLQAGEHRQELELSGFAAGMYFVELQTGKQTQFEKLIHQP